MWNLENWYWYWWTYLQGRNRDANVANELVDTVGEGKGGTNWKSSTEIHTPPCTKQRASGNLLYITGSSARGSVMTEMGGMGRWEALEWGYRWIRTADSLCYMAETNTTIQFSCVWPSATSWTAAHQASLSITNSQSLPKPMSIESVMPSNYLILCRPLLLLHSILPSVRVFSSESVLRIRWPKYWSFSFSISPIL